MPDRPNIVLISVDQWRGDCLSVAGHPVVHTPFLDMLALDGVRFTGAYSAVPSCIAARAALFTGLSQRSHGRVGYRDEVPWNYETTLAGEFTRHGYQTQAIGKMHVYPERSQLGFQNVILHDGYTHAGCGGLRALDQADDYLPWLAEQLGRRADYYEHGVHSNSYVARPWDKAEYQHPTNWLVSESVDFLRRRDPRKPFLLFMSFHRPHPPYDPPGWVLDQYLHREMPPPPVGDWMDLFAHLADPCRPICNVGELPPQVLQRARAGYYGHMTHIDCQVNRFLSALLERGLRENTYVCFVSDHGEMLGDHHMFRKCYPYEGSAHVPLVLRGPKDGRVPVRQTCDALVELRDLMPTLLDLAGLPVPETVEGRSLLPLLHGEPAPWREYLHGEHMILGRSMQWITNGKEKYLWHSTEGQEQLFDLVADPQECHDLMRTPEGEARVRRWRRALAAELQGREEGYSDGERLIPGRTPRTVLSHLLG